MEAKKDVSDLGIWASNNHSRACALSASRCSLFPWSPIVRSGTALDSWGVWMCL